MADCLTDLPHLQADVIVSDVNLPSSFNLWSRTKYVFIGRHNIRHPGSIPHHVVSTTIHISHTQCGGVTDGHWNLRLYYVDCLSWDPSLLPQVTQRDLSSVVCATTGFGLPCPPPPFLTSPEVNIIRPGVYHGGGLFPFYNRTAYFVVPNIYSNTKWCHRHFMAEETLAALDIAAEHIDKLDSSDRKRVCNDSFFLPTKVTLTVVHSITASLDAYLVGPSNPSLQSPVALQPTPSYVAAASSPDAPIIPEINDRLARTMQSVKADDAEVPVYLWDDRIWPDAPSCVRRSLNTMREWRLKLWRRNMPGVPSLVLAGTWHENNNSSPPHVSGCCA
jgi:hypothetical protein